MSLRYQTLPGLPADGTMAIPFRANEWSGAWSGHSEGLVVRFNLDTRETWVANFKPGSGSAGWEGVLEHPNGKHLVVLARGQGYVVDPATRQCVEVLSGCILDVVELPDFGAILLSDGIRFEAIKSDGIWWSSPRISWDEMRNIKVEGAILRGEASSPVRGDNPWVPFTLDLMTGRCEDGVYESDMQRAIPVKPGPSSRS